ncbi:MAG: PAS domain S-box protein [Proteobacteria bacterium]|nr:MAG: PAS domain S-box protein [Pseudomonadota bacterium]
MTQTPSTSASKTPISCIVGIGASAGGHVALREFFEKLDSQRLAFVVIQHLEANAEALAIEVMAQHSRLPVVAIKEGMEVEAGMIFIAPPHTLVSLEQNIFHTQAAEGNDQRRSMIDQFLSSLADDQGQKAIGIIFSGEGSDGTEGLKAIGDSGGMTIAQYPDTAEFPSMPEAAIRSGAVDHILPIPAMAEEIGSYEKYILRMLDQTAITRLRDQIASALVGICEILYKATGHDFKHYKTNTLVRRIQRRMQVLQLKFVESYVERLQEKSEEIDALFKELLINVTSFFRDPTAFEELRQSVLQKALAKHPPSQKYRVWIAGCSTGEEAYTIAIIIREIISEMKQAPDVQIIATDIDEVALNAARRGSYSASIADDINPERLKRFFVRKAGRYVVSKELREMCLFSSHNIINDPPFSQLDLLTCRNVLIYLGPHLQQKLIPVFHYALRPNGYLFLGTSESLTGHQELFRTVSAKYRIAQRRTTAIKSPVSFGSMSSTYNNRPNEPMQSHEIDLNLVGQRIILDEFSPKYAIVNEDGQIISVSAGVHRYFEPSEGMFHNSILKLVKPNLRTSLRSAFTTAKKLKRKVTNENVAIEIDGDYQRVGLVVQPMPQLGEGMSLFMIIFQYFGHVPKAEALEGDREASVASIAAVEQLERELTMMREDLDKTVQDLEASNEELKSSNEELLSMNEELQSANEELETSKEDVQAANEALLRSNSDLANLLAGTEIATLFLDDELRIKSFTPEISRFYRILPSDVGREIDDFMTRAVSMPPYPSRTELAESSRSEVEISTPDGRIYLRRTNPYRTHEGYYEGLVVTFIDITEIRQIEGRFQTLVNMIPSISWMATPEGKINFFNERWFEYTGLNADDGLPTQASPFIHPEDILFLRDEWNYSIASGENFQGEFRLKRADGIYRWYLGQGVALRDRAGKIIQWFGTCVDIEAKKVEVDLLKESGDGLRTIIETIPQYIWRAEPDGSADYCSESFVSFVGKSREEILGWGWIELIHPEDRNRVAEEWSKARAAEVKVSIEFRLMREGREHWVRAEGNPFFDSQGQLSKYYGTWTDIQQQVITEFERIDVKEQLEESEARFRLLADAMPQIVFTADSLGNINYFNERWSEYTGFSFEQTRDWGWGPVLHPEDLQYTIDRWKHSINTGELYEIEYRLKSAIDGSYRWHLGRAIPVSQSVGKGTRWFGTNTDIHEVKLMTEELLLAKQNAESANQIKSRFLANMSHEIRTPLGVIIGFTDLLKDHIDDKVEATNYIDRIGTNAKQLGSLIDEILDLSKIEADRLEAERLVVDLKALFEDVFANMKMLANDKGLSFESNWKTAALNHVVTDLNRFRQILINVIGNAIKFTEKGKVSVLVSENQTRESRTLEVRVIDTGIGLNEEQQSRIFEPFMQADSSVTRRYGGTGLGLALSKRLARVLGGDLILEKTDSGKGSTFTITIDIGEPLVPLGSDEDKTSVKAPEREKYPSLPAHLHVLIVDDSPDNRAIVSRFLKLSGCRFDIAENGQIAVEKALTGAFDIVLMDIQMPVMDGYQALRSLKERGYGKPIIALTAHAMKEEKDRCLEAGFTGYLSKPVDRRSLLQLIESFAQSAKAPT